MQPMQKWVQLAEAGGASQVAIKAMFVVELTRAKPDWSSIAATGAGAGTGGGSSLAGVVAGAGNGKAGGGGGDSTFAGPQVWMYACVHVGNSTACGCQLQSSISGACGCQLQSSISGACGYPELVPTLYKSNLSMIVWSWLTHHCQTITSTWLHAICVGSP